MLRTSHKIDDSLWIVVSVGVSGVNAEWDGVNAAEPLHKKGFPLHDAEAPRGCDVPVAEDSGRVADDGNGVPAVGECHGGVVVGADAPGNLRHAGGVPHVEPVVPCDRYLGEELHLAAEIAVRGFGDALVEGRLATRLLVLGEPVGKALVYVGKIPFYFVCFE